MPAAGLQTTYTSLYIASDRSVGSKMLINLVITLFFGNILASPLQGSNDGGGLVVQTTSGLLYGALNSTVPGVRQWLAVPFAKPPVDDLRWMPPVALSKNASQQSLQTKTFGPSCPQYESQIKSVYNSVVREFFIYGSTSEDCLTLSIWSPQYPKSNSLPVVIWLYGGGLTTGGSSVPYQNPSKWVQRTQAHIVVSIQYRLNIFGFPNAAGLADQNLGFLDQRLGMEWVRNNIGKFGGDTSKMILWGQSAGARSTDIQNFAFPEDPIVQGFISDSGSALSSTASTDSAQSNFTFVASQFNCTGSSTEILACFRQVPQLDIEAFLLYYTDSGQTPTISFPTVVDNKIVFANYTQRLLAGNVSNAPAIFGNQRDDGQSLVSVPPPPSPPNATASLQRELSIRCPQILESRFRDSIGLTTYRFQCNGNFSNISPLAYMGAYHSAELPLVFGTYGDFRGPSSELEIQTSEAMQDLWLAFANDPRSLPSKGWATYNSGKMQLFGASQASESIDPSTVEAPCESYRVAL